METPDLNLDEQSFNPLKETAITLLGSIEQAFVPLSAVNQTELAHFSESLLKDFHKIKASLYTLQHKIITFITITLTGFNEDPVNTAEKLTQTRLDLSSSIHAITRYTDAILKNLPAEDWAKLLSEKLQSMQKICVDMLKFVDALNEEIIEAPVQNMPQEIIEKPDEPIPVTASLLIVDDDPENRTLLESWLHRRSFKTSSVRNGAEALAYLEKYPDTDIVLLTIIMNEMNGFEILKRIRNNLRLAQVMVIVISSVNDTNNIVHCIKNGAEDYLIKPFNAWLLNMRVDACLEKKRLKDHEKNWLAVSQEQSVTRKIKPLILPVQIPLSDKYSIYGRSIPAREAGGDFYDWNEIGDEQLAFCIGDVSGKGISAALSLVITKTILSTLTNSYASAGKNVSEANRLLMKNKTGSLFATLFYAVLDTQNGKLTFVNASHWQPVLIKKSGDQIVLKEYSGPAIGITENVEYQEFTAHMEPGDTLFLYTDGVPEAVNEDHEAFALNELQKTLSKCRNKSPRVYVEKVIHDVLNYEEDIFDDITCLAVSLVQES